tara:strand:+ start:504 stop:713 length:210 start_codon:yes stop_codon:yes gene_type:complete
MIERLNVSFTTESLEFFKILAYQKSVKVWLIWLDVTRTLPERDQTAKYFLTTVVVHYFFQKEVVQSQKG